MEKIYFSRFVLLFIVYLLMMCGYIFWRAYFTLNLHQPISSLLFLFTDVVTGLSSLIFVITFWKQKQDANHVQSNGNFTVDVWIPTINEDIEVLQRTISHCISLDYPHITYVLDDGNREEVKQLAANLGAFYIARDNNEHAKAGNLNNAMNRTKGDLIAIFDADFIPEKNFILRLEGYFIDPEMAIVQTPQHYYNIDSFQHRYRLGKRVAYSDQDTFMHTVLPARSKWNAAYWIGTNALIRRKALTESGGFQTASVTEDVLTSMYIHANGWKTVFIDESLAHGLAPVNISQYAIQRLRWAKGAFQILRNNNPLLLKGLTTMQKLFYFSSLLHFIEGFLRLMYYLFPALFFIFHLIPVHSAPYIIITMTFYFVAGRFLLSYITKKKISFFLDEVYAVIRSFIYFMAVPALLTKKKLPFAITPKNSRFSNEKIRNFFGPLLVFTFNFVVFVSAIINPAIILTKGVLAGVCFTWCIYFLILSFTACYFCFTSTAKRKMKPDNISFSDFSKQSKFQEEVVVK